jgi:hypothetical protein
MPASSRASQASTASSVAWRALAAQSAQASRASARRRSRASSRRVPWRGVSTRSVDDLVRAMGMEGISRSRISRLRAEIDGRVRDFLARPIKGSA